MQEVAQSPEDSRTQALQAFLDLPSKFPLWLQVLSAMEGAHLEVHLDAVCRHPPGNPYIPTLLTMRREGVLEFWLRNSLCVGLSREP